MSSNKNTALVVFFYIFLYIVMVGSLNWGLIGVFNFNLVQFISNRSKKVENSIYILVGFSTIVLFILSIIMMASHPEYFLSQDEKEEISEIME